ncbi:hypothetical protein PZF67_006347 [Pseudomonas aeruginosa]|uniref:hypothetical protein n=1 Tax=Pseudomonas aeruginosa TaxID=287 RepID=UPI00155E5A66|nr:hypothetical protein [Pseudomonas aeruginosa]EKW9641295.1 hypothetical protein [Pseudomonas aeruginosa]NRC34061.1 hypothetical protein [Pseudomonas aeruginosa]
MKSPTPFSDFDAAMKAIQSASTKVEVLLLVDQIDAEYAADTLQLTPENWGALASAVMIRGDELAA